MSGEVRRVIFTVIFEGRTNLPLTGVKDRPDQGRIVEPKVCFDNARGKQFPHA